MDGIYVDPILSIIFDEFISSSKNGQDRKNKRD